MMSAREELLDALRAAMAEVSPGHTVAAAFETPKQADHGDLAVTAAMPLAKAQKRNPREVAAELIAALRAKTAVERWVESIAVAGPGFINLHLRAAARQRVVAEALAGGAAFGTKAATGDPVMVEFVSANPTGPLHVGHARQAALGDAICNLLETQGRRVVREFYYNDAGVQIATLAASVKARLDGLRPGDPDWPEAAYNGDYVADIAADFVARKTVHADDREFTASGDTQDLDGIRQFAVAYLRHEQDLDLQAFGVRFDNYYLESSLYQSGRVEATVARLIAAGKTYEDGGALWLRTTDYGDDKDRVMRKSDGRFTYFVPDVAYHLAKFERGFTTAINIQGTDHHGTIARVRAGLQAAGAGVPPRYPEYVLNTMVRVERGGEEVKISKRAGNYVTLRDLIDWTSRDAVRFFMLSRKADTEFTFDVDLALKQNDENPVFYVQYAHARICSVLEQYAGQGGDVATLASADLGGLVAPSEIALLRKLGEYGPMLAAAAATLAPHEVAFYLRELAATFHSYYGAERFLVEDRELARARMALLAATRQIIRNALAVLGVAAPERMKRDGHVMKAPHIRSAQRGGFLIGLVVGLLIGLAAALGVALYVTKAPNPFVNKVPARTPTQDAAEAEKNRNWDPNSALAGRNPAPGASGVVGDPVAPATRPTLVAPTVIDPVLPPVPDARVARPGGAASGTVAQVPAPRASQVVTSTLSAGAFTYFVQAGAYSRSEDAEQQRAKLAMLGVESRLTEREQGGRMVYRVRVGPFERREDAENAKERLGDSGVDSALVAVQK